MMTKKKLRAEIDALRMGITNRDATNNNLLGDVADLRTRNGQLKAECNKYIREANALSAKVTTYEEAYHSAQEFLLHASAALTEAYTKLIASAGGDTNVNDDG